MKSRDVPRNSVRVLFDFFILTFLFVFLFFSPWFYGLTRFRDRLIAESLLFALFLLVLPRVKIETVFRRDFRSLDAWVLLGLCICLLYTGISAVPWISLTAFINFLSVVLVYWMVRTLVDSEKRFNGVLWLVFLMGVFYSVYGLMQYKGIFPKAYWYQEGFLSSRLVNSGHFAGFLLFPVFFGLGLWTGSGWKVRAMILPMMAVLLLALVLSRSRTVWIALCSGLFVCFLGYLRHGRVSKKIMAASVLLLLTGGAVAGHKILAVILERFRQISAAQEIPFYTLLFRMDLWRASFDALLARPWGWGVGAFSSIILKFRVNDDRFLIDYAHNELCQVGVDLGVMGILLLLALSVFYLRTATAFTQKNPAGPCRMVGSVFAGLFLGLLISSQFDFPLRIYSNGLLWGLFMGLSAWLFESNPSSDPLPAEAPRAKSFLLKGVVFVLVFGALLFTGFYLRAEILSEEGKGREKQFEFLRAREAYQRAVAWMPVSDRYRRSLADLDAKMMTLSFDGQKRKSLYEEAAQSYREAIRLNAYEPTHHYFLALLEEEHGALGEAGGSFEKAIALDPLNGFYVLEYARFLLRHSQTEKAADYFEKFRSFKFREYPGSEPCVLVNEMSQKTKRYEDLKRIIPDEWRFHLCLGMVLANEAQWGAAQTEFDRTLEQARSRFPRSEYHERARMPIAAVYTSSGMGAEAVKLYRKELALDPKDPDAERELASLLKNKTGS